MKRIFYLPALAIMLFTGFLSCKKTADTGVQINFINATGMPLQAASADGVVVGNIEADAETGILHFRQFSIDTDMPDCSFTATQNGRITESLSRFYWCGTEKTTVTDGSYDIVIKLVQHDTAQYFNLQFRR